MKMGNLLLSSHVDGMIFVLLHAMKWWLLLLCAMGPPMTGFKIQGLDPAMVGLFLSLLVVRTQLEYRKRPDLVL